MYEQCPNGCDDFMLFSCELDAENNAVAYRCSVCDWEEVENNPFYVSAWIVRVSQEVAAIDIIQSALTDKNVVQFLRPRLKGESFLSNRTTSAWDFTVGSDEYLQGEINTAYQVYLRQMIVLAATYTELILKEFFDSFFSARPSDLLKLLAEKEAFRKRVMNEVSFEKIIDNTAKETVMNHALNSMQRDDRWRIVKRLADQAPITLDRKLLFDRLRSLTAQRDEIVHNSLYNPFGDEVVDAQKVYGEFKLIISLLGVLERVAAKNGIPYWKEFDHESDEFIK